MWERIKGDVDTSIERIKMSYERDEEIRIEAGDGK
jgi:hypothetical protein